MSLSKLGGRLSSLPTSLLELQQNTGKTDFNEF